MSYEEDFYDHVGTELMTVYYSTNQRHVAEIFISVVSVSHLMANSLLQVLKIVKSGYVLFLFTPPYHIIHCDWPRKQEERREKKRGKEKRRRANTRSGTSKPVESDPSSRATCKKSIHSISPEMVDSSFLDLEIKVLEYGILKRGLVYLI